MRKSTSLLAHGPLPNDCPRDLWAIVRVDRVPYLMVATDDDVAEFDLGCDPVVKGHDEAESGCGYCDLVALSTATFSVVSVKVSTAMVKAILDEVVSKEDFGYFVAKLSDTLSDIEDTDCPVYCGDFQAHKDRAEWVLYCHNDSGLFGNADEYEGQVNDEFNRLLKKNSKKK